MDTSRADTGSSQTINFGFQGQGPGYAYALAASAVQFVGIGVFQPGGKAHGVHEFTGLFSMSDFDMPPRTIRGSIMASHTVFRGSREEGILKDNLHVFPDFFQFFS